MEFSWRRRTPSTTSNHLESTTIASSPSPSTPPPHSSSPSPSPKNNRKNKWNIARLPHSMHYYALLGLTDNPLCSQDDIRRAYHRQALRLHPDKNPGKEADFKHLVEAYSTLGDRGRRRLYDKYGTIAINLLDSFGDGGSSSSKNSNGTIGLEFLIGFLLNMRGMRICYIAISLIILGAISTPLISAWRLCFFPDAEATTRIKMLPWSMIVGFPLQIFYLTFLIIASISLHLSWKLKGDNGVDGEMAIKMQEIRRKERLSSEKRGYYGGDGDGDGEVQSLQQPSAADLQKFALWVAVILLFVGVGTLSFQTLLLTLKLDSFLFFGSCSWWLIFGPYLIFESVIISWNVISAIMYANDGQFWKSTDVGDNDLKISYENYPAWKVEYAPLRGMLFVRPYFIYKKIRSSLLRGYMSTSFCLLINGKLSSLWFLFAPLYAIFTISILLDRLVLGRKIMMYRAANDSGVVSSIPFRVISFLKIMIILQIALLHWKAIKMSLGQKGPTWFWCLSPFLLSQIILIGGILGMGILGFFFIPDLRKNNPFVSSNNTNTTSPSFSNMTPSSSKASINETISPVIPSSDIKVTFDK